MLKHSSLLIATALSLCAALAFAQEVRPVEKAPAAGKKSEEAKKAATSAPKKPAAKPLPKSTPKASPSEAPTAEVVATPAPKKPGFLQRIFGGRKNKTEATPTPTPTPAPPRVARRSAAAPAPAEKPPAPPAPAKTTVKGKPKPATEEAAKPANEPPADADPDVKERFRFEQAKTKAAEDPQVKSLKAKADDAATDDESRKALRAYNKALFEKIRKLDGSVSERATRLEAAILKRLSE